MDITFNEEWAAEQTNRPLMNEDVAGYAYVASLEADIQFHPERWKNWDNYLAVYHACNGSQGPRREWGFHDPILDAGACRDPKSPSSFLPSLHDIGYTRLFGCNLDEPADGVREGGVNYTRDDITHTHFKDNMFRFVACLSTLEHGVNEFDFLDEMWRVLRPGGSLFMSFDYWHDKIDTGGRMAFGAPVRVFNHCDVEDMLCYARNIGFTAPTHYEWRCDEPVVKWLGLEYTFMNLLVSKPAPL